MTFGYYFKRVGLPLILFTIALPPTMWRYLSVSGIANSQWWSPFVAMEEKVMVPVVVIFALLLCNLMRLGDKRYDEWEAGREGRERAEYERLRARYEDNPPEIKIIK
jgi:hypothetical protein